MVFDLDKDFYLEYSSSDLKTYGFDAEWLLADRLGGFASQTLVGSCSRRYHSLYLINTPHGRINVLPQIEEFISSGSLVPLSTNVYQDVTYPEGYLQLRNVLVGPTVCFEYAFGEQLLFKEIFKPEGKNTTYIRYQMQGVSPCRLVQVPLFSGTYHHALRRKSTDHLLSCLRNSNAIELKCSFLDRPLYFHHSSLDNASCYVEDNQDWFYNFRLEKERERGLDFIADWYAAIKFSSHMSSKEEVVFAISDQPMRGRVSDIFSKDYDLLYRALKKKKNSVENSSASLNLLSQNHNAFFIKTNRNSQGIVAGYHWFEEWGRDTFISLGLLTEEDLQNQAFIQSDIHSIYKDFFSHSRNGILPNRFESSGSGDGYNGAEYNSVDSLLWAIASLYKIQKKIEDKNLFKQIWIAMCGHVDAYVSGTDFGIQVNKQTSLLFAGDSDTQLTWMDARVNGIPITPRAGACVEINALFYNALRILEEVCSFYNDQSGASRYKSLSEKVYKAFRGKFMLLDKGYLADRIYLDAKMEEHVDPSFRPNQIFALSLAFPLLTKREARLVLQKVEDKLLTPFGLRTLSRDGIDYKPTYQGGILERDSAYHQGTVWPWLLGAYTDAVIEYGPEDFRPKLEDTLDSLIKHIGRDGIGYVSEVFGGDDDKSGGAIAQCWSGAAVRYCLSKLRT